MAGSTWAACAGAGEARSGARRVRALGREGVAAGAARDPRATRATRATRTRATRATRAARAQVWNQTARQRARTAKRRAPSASVAGSGLRSPPGQAGGLRGPREVAGVVEGRKHLNRRASSAGQGPAGELPRSRRGSYVLPSFSACADGGMWSPEWLNEAPTRAWVGSARNPRSIRLGKMRQLVRVRFRERRPRHCALHVGLASREVRQAVESVHQAQDVGHEDVGDGEVVKISSVMRSSVGRGDRPATVYFFIDGACGVASTMISAGPAGKSSGRPA